MTTDHSALGRRRHLWLAGGAAAGLTLAVGLLGCAGRATDEAWDPPLPEDVVPVKAQWAGPPQIAVWTSWPRAQRWAVNFRKSGLRPTNLTVMVSMGSAGGPDREFDQTVAAIRQLRRLGIDCVPACATLTRAYGHTYESWFDRRVWRRMARRVEQLAQLRAPGDPRLAMDMEAYIGGKRRYPPRDWVGSSEKPVQRELTVALEPLIRALRAQQVKPLLLGSPLTLSANDILHRACPNAVALPEDTYRCPVDPRYWRHLQANQATFAILSERGDWNAAYWPGFFAGGLRSKAFQAELRRRGVRRCWYWFRTPAGYGDDSDDPDEFGTAGWGYAPNGIEFQGH